MNREERRLRTRLAHLVVYEATGRWAALLRRLVAGWPLRETRSAAECLDRVGDRPASFVVVELLPAELDEALSLLARLDAAFPQACPVAVGGPQTRPCEWLAREAGARHVVRTVRHAPVLADLAQRHFRTVPTPELGLREKILTGLFGDAV